MKLPPSSQIVLSLLAAGKAFTNKEIVERTGLSPRTVRYAIQKLRERHMITWEWNFDDARQVRYRKGSPDGAGAPEQEPEPCNRVCNRSSRSFAGTR